MNTHTATGSKNDPTEGPDKGPNPDFQEAYGVGQAAGKTVSSGKFLYTAMWACFSLVVEMGIVGSIIWESLATFCPDSNPLQVYWESNDAMMKDLIQDPENGYDETDYDYIPRFHLHQPVDPTRSFPKSASRVLAMWILGMSLGKEIMDILTVCILIHSVDRLQKRPAFTFEVFLIFMASYGRLVCCCAVCFMSFVIVKNSQTILDIWKDCVAIAFIVEIDSLLFSAMKKGMLTGAMMDCTKNFPGKIYITEKQSPRMFLTYGGYFVSTLCIILMGLMLAREVNTKLFEESINKMGAMALFGSTDCDIEYIENDWNQADFLMNATNFDFKTPPGGR
jgi:hypothetical protein